MTGFNQNLIYTCGMDEGSQDSHDIAIERAVPADARAIVVIRREAWLDAYPNPALGISKDDIRDRIEGEHGEFTRAAIQNWRKGLASEGDKNISFVARQGGEVKGFVGYRVENDVCRISTMYVEPGAQGMGIGTRLMQRALGWNEGNDLYLEVVTYNQKAIDFYQNFGFKKTDKLVVDENAQREGVKELPMIEMVLKEQLAQPQK